MFNKDKKSDDVYVKNTDFYGLSSALFGKKWADEHQMLTVLNDVLEKVANRQDNAYAVARKIYNAKSQADLLNILAEKNKVIDSITANDGSFYELSISDIMDIYNGMKNDKTKRLFIENYEEIDEEGNQKTHNIDNLFKNLSDEDKAYADFMQKDLEQNYDELNKLYVKLYGIDMKKEENYWARTSEKPDPFYDLKDAKGFSPLSTIASQMKERATTVKPVPSNAIAKYNKGVSDYYYMTTAFEKFKDIYDVVTSKYVKVAIQGKYDSNVYEALADHLRAMSLSGNQIHLSDIDNKANQVVANIVGSKIALNVNVFFKQLISITNYSENMPVVEFSKNLVEGIMHPKETIKYMNDIAGSFLSTRMKGGLQSEAVARFIKESQSLNSKWFKAGTKYNWTEFMGTFVKYGDIIPIYFGGYARVKYLMDNGATKQEALDKFKFETLQTQQAANAAALAGYQRSKNPAARLFSAFLNAPAQYMRKLYNADIQYRRGEITHEQFIKTTMNYGVVQPAIYIMLSNILRGLWNDDDDTPFYEGLVSYLVTSPFQGIPLAGSILQNVGTAIEKRIADKYVANDVVGVLFVDDINRAWRKANKKDIEFLDWFDIITPIIEPLVQAPITSVKQVARAIDSRL
jgi:acyl carrier protein phosphodiesterase